MIDDYIQQNDECDRKILEATGRVAYEELASFQQPSVSFLYCLEDATVPACSGNIQMSSKGGESVC